MSDLTPEVIEEGLRLWEAASEASTLPRAASWGRVAAHARQHYGPALREVQRLRAEVEGLRKSLSRHQVQLHGYRCCLGILQANLDITGRPKTGN